VAQAGKVPSPQAQSPEFKPQYRKKKRRKKKDYQESLFHPT
jgi:hypothetical protein